MKIAAGIRSKAAIATFAAVLFSGFAFVGCDKENSVAPNTTQNDVSATSDAAEVTASAVGEENGGMVDQLGDALEGASTDNFQGLAKTTDGETMDAVYDPVAGMWTITINRERGDINGNYYAAIARVYHYQFLNQAGDPQQYWITNGDTARTIKFDIVSGSGRHITPRLSQQLNQLEGNFVVTQAHLRNLVINGTYARAAVDTVTTHRAVRTLDHSISLQITDLTGPRGKRFDLSRKISGTISGHVSAYATFQSGSGYGERNIERDFTIVIGDGKANINIGGETFEGEVQTGEIVD